MKLPPEMEQNPTVFLNIATYIPCYTKEIIFSLVLNIRNRKKGYVGSQQIPV